MKKLVDLSNIDIKGLTNRNQKKFFKAVKISKKQQATYSAFSDENINNQLSDLIKKIK